MRKYFTEFGLNVSTSYKTLIPVEHVQHVKDEHAYHIYFILSCPKLFINPESIVKEKDKISLQMYEIVDGKPSEMKNVSFHFQGNHDHSKFEIECNYPYLGLDISLESGKRVSIDSQTIMDYGNPGNKVDFEVLYIGQAYGDQGSRVAQDRLKSHSTLQKILTDYNVKYPDKRIYIFLLEICPILNTIMDGFHKSMASEEEENKHFKDVFENPLKMDQIINITEAALINYFKPEYNINFVENFPDTEHKGYTQYFDLDYNSLTVELDLEFGYPYTCISFYTDTNVIKNSFDIIQYDLFNDPDRDSMYAMFLTPSDMIKEE